MTAMTSLEEVLVSKRITSCQLCAAASSAPGSAGNKYDVHVSRRRYVKASNRVS
jgi:hypothetical protein